MIVQTIKEIHRSARTSLEGEGEKNRFREGKVGERKGQVATYKYQAEKLVGRIVCCPKTGETERDEEKRGCTLKREEKARDKVEERKEKSQRSQVV